MLNTYIKDAIAPVLLGAGFRATGRVYRREAGDAFHVVDIQNWKYNDSKRARFTIEVGVCFPRLLAAVSELDAYAFYKPNVAKPGITECAVRRRLGMFLTPPEDTWWTVSATTGYVPPAEQITGPLTTAALPWTQDMSAISALVAAGKANHTLSSPVMEVAALFALGQESAATVAAASLSKARHPTQPILEKGLLDELLSLQWLEPPHASKA
jgi:hypothetical protein